MRIYLTERATFYDLAVHVALNRIMGEQASTPKEYRPPGGQDNTTAVRTARTQIKPSSVVSPTTANYVKLSVVE